MSELLDHRGNPCTFKPGDIIEIKSLIGYGEWQYCLAMGIHYPVEDTRLDDEKEWRIGVRNKKSNRLVWPYAIFCKMVLPPNDGESPDAPNELKKKALNDGINPEAPKSNVLEYLSK